MSLGRTWRLGLGAAALGALTTPVALELKIPSPTQPLTPAWRAIPIEPRRATPLGISFRTGPPKPD